MKNATFVLVVALLSVVFAGCLMGSPLPATGSCPNRGDSMLCTQTNGCQGIQACGYTSLPGGGHGTDLHWGLCTGPETCAMPVDTGVATVDGGTTGTDSGTSDDAGMTVADAGMTGIDAGMSLDAGPPCDPSIVRSCTGACGVPGAFGFLINSCDPTGPCVRDLTDLSGGCTTVTPTDCPCVGIECSLLTACLTVCDHAGVQTWQDFCLGDACYPVFPESCTPVTDAGIDAGPTVVDAGAGIIDAGTDAGPPDLGPTDAGPSDLGPADAGPPDMGPVDAGPPDAGPTDAGPPDGGPVDAGPPDAGPTDAGPRDLGPTDAGPPDMGPRDLGPTDAGPSDLGPTDAGRDAGVGETVMTTVASLATLCPTGGGNEDHLWDNTPNQDWAGPSPLRVPMTSSLSGLGIYPNGSPLNTSLWCVGGGVYEVSSALRSAPIGSSAASLATFTINGVAVPGRVCWDTTTAGWGDRGESPPPDAFRRIQIAASSDSSLFLTGCAPGTDADGRR